MIARFLHEALGLHYSAASRSFLKSSLDIEGCQRQVLRNIVRNLNASKTWSSLNPRDPYEKLRDQVEIRDYAGYEKLVLEQRSTGRPLLSANVQRYEPTSGSTSERKWIPYTPELLSEFNRAAALWLGDIYERYPSVKSGFHYWSLSWLPEDVRQEITTNDTELFPWYQRHVLQSTMAVDPNIASLPKSEQAWWATLLNLAACKELSLVSVWSPTFWLKIMDDLVSQWTEISNALQNGKWGRHSEILQRHLGPAPMRNVSRMHPGQKDFYPSLWPKLKFISAWDSSSSRNFAHAIQESLPHVHFQGKGLWATEGVVSVPYREKKVLAINSHFYEFRNLASGEIVPAWKLRNGCEYQPLLWTSSGLLRYPLPDRVVVTDHFNSVPCLEFQGRLRSVDMVGEKVSSNWVDQLFSQNSHWQAISLVAVHKPQAHYVLLCQSKGVIDLEEELQKLHHYRLARQLGQLNPARVEKVANIFEVLRRTGKSQILGQNKIEVLLEVPALN